MQSVLNTTLHPRLSCKRMMRYANMCAYIISRDDYLGKRRFWGRKSNLKDLASL